MVGSQKYNINGNEITGNDTITPDPAAITVELGNYAEDNTNSAAMVKHANGESEVFIVQSSFFANSGLIVSK